MLQEIADAMQAPKRWLWSMLPGLHDPNTGEAYSGSQVAHNAFGTDPDSVWGKALGFGLDVAGDPLTLLGGMAARGVGAAARGVGLLGEAVAPAAEAAGGGAAALAGSAAEAAPAWGPSSVSAMRGLRDTFGMVKNVRAMPEGMSPLVEEAMANANLPRRMVLDPSLGHVGEAVGSVPRNVQTFGSMGQFPGGVGAEAMARAAPDIAAGDIGGAFFPYDGPGTTGVGLSSSPISNRHEVIHGLVNAIAGGAPSSGVPLPIRIPGLLGRLRSPLAQGASQVLNEAAAHAAESRTALGQLSGYAGFLMNPHPGYYGQIANTSPLIAAMHQSLPYAAGATAAGGGYLAGNALFSGN